MKSEHTETIQKAFIMQSRHFETHKANFTQKGLFDHVVSEVQPKKTDHILEVAVGTCICGRVFAPFVHEVTCLDVTPAMLAVGKTQAEKQAYNNMMFVTGDAEKLPFLDYSFGKSSISPLWEVKSGQSLADGITQPNSQWRDSLTACEWN